MLTLLFSICMFQFARLELRRGWIWGPLTFAVSALIQVFLISGYWGALLGFLSCYGWMTYMNFKYPVNKGPTLNNTASGNSGSD